MRAGRPVELGEVRIVPIERVRCAGGRLGGLWVHGSLEPVGAIVATPGSVRLLDLAGRPLPAEALGKPEDVHALLSRFGRDA